ncbi:MAG: flavin-containing monooxygenase [Leucobacter sp.]
MHANSVNTPEPADALPQRYAIVGGGPAGLLVARAFLKRGVPFEILERHDEIGGIWNIEQVSSPMYQSCNFISSRDYGGFIGFEMPRDYPMYPKWHQIRDYVRSFARAYGIDRHVRLGAEVTNARAIDTEAGRYWRVALANGVMRDYRGVVIATGAQWVPVIPEIPGIETFTGRVAHSAQYGSTDEFVGKRVLVVGAGNSGVDIAADAAFFADTARLSTRRGYRFFPKFTHGIPTPDLLAENIPEEELPRALRGKTFEEKLQIVVDAVGDLTNFGLPVPDHGFGQTHPIMNSQVLHALAHGLLEHRPDIASVDGATVTFADGREEDFDVLLFATGYDVEVPWLDEGVLTYHNGHPDAVIGAFFEDQEGLYQAGALHFAGNTFSIFDQEAQFIAAEADAVLHGTNVENVARLRASYRPNLREGADFLDTRRNGNQVHIPALEKNWKTLEEEYLIPIPQVGDGEFYAGLRVDQ